MASNKYHVDFKVDSVDATHILRQYIANSETPIPLRSMRDKYIHVSDLRRRISEFPMATRVRILLPLMRNKIIVPYKVHYDNGYKPDTYLAYDIKALSEHFQIHINTFDSHYDNIRFQYASQRFIRMLASFISHADLNSYDEAILTSMIYSQDRTSLLEDRHFDITSKGEMTYTPKNKPTIITSNGNWSTKGRQSIKYGKGLRKFTERYTSYLSDNIYEQYHNFIYSEFNFTHELRLVSGEDIRTFYHNINQNNNIRALENSCMKHSRCQPYLEMYVKSPNVKLLVALNKNEVVQGRALIFENVTDDNGQEYTVMERIYTDDKYISNFKEYAKEKGWIYKSRQTWDKEPFIAANGTQIPQRLSVTFQNPTNERYPYMDSFKYTDDINSYTITLNTDHGVMALTTTTGNIDGHDTVEDYYGNTIDRDVACWSSMTDSYYHEDDCNYSDYHGTYIQIDDSVYIESQGDYYHVEDDDIMMDESTGDYELLDNLWYCEYHDCYASDVVECIIHGTIPMHKATFFTHGDVNYYYTSDYTPQGLVTYCKEIYVSIVTEALPEAAQHVIDNPNLRDNPSTTDN